ncbi:MAG: hypothetical protein ABEK75_03965 [Salinibacter sp.]
MVTEGLRFTPFYAGSTVCTPSRSVRMTDQHTGRTPIRGAQTGEFGNTRSGTSVTGRGPSIQGFCTGRQCTFRSM